MVFGVPQKPSAAVFKVFKATVGQLCNVFTGIGGRAGNVSWTVIGMEPLINSLAARDSRQKHCHSATEQPSSDAGAFEDVPPDDDKWQQTCNDQFPWLCKDETDGSDMPVVNVSES